MSHCAVYGCNNHYRKTRGSNIKYFTFPKDKHLREKWENCCKRQDTLPKSPCICSAHFHERSYEVPLKQLLLNYTPRNSRNLKPDAIPTENLPTSGKNKIQFADVDRVLRHERRNRKKEVIELLKVATSENDADSTVVVPMDMIKLEPELDPLALQHEDSIKEEEEEEVKTLLMAGDFLKVDVNKIKVESSEISCDGLTGMKYEENEDSISYPVLKFEDEEMQEVKEEPMVDMTSDNDLVESPMELLHHDSEKNTEGEAQDFIVAEADITAHQQRGPTDNSPAQIKDESRGEDITAQPFFNEEMQIQPAENSFTCSICNKTFSYFYHLQKHQMTHTHCKPYKCNICDKYFSKPQEHALVHTSERPFKCELCGKDFKRLRSWRAHWLIHSGEKPYKCDTCNKNFRHREYLIVHMRSHTRDKPFKCDVCGKCFSYSHTLKIHVRGHNREKPPKFDEDISFKCDVCNKHIKYRQNFVDHMRIHTGEKPFKCDICDKDFRVGRLLKEHIRIHTGEKPYKCDDCGKEFRLSKDFRVHGRIHSGEKPFKCDTCGKEFRLWHNLKYHVGTHSK